MTTSTRFRLVSLVASLVLSAGCPGRSGGYSDGGGNLAALEDCYEEGQIDQQACNDDCLDEQQSCNGGCGDQECISECGDESQDCISDCGDDADSDAEFCRTSYGS